MHKKISEGPRASRRTGILFVALTLIVPLISGCSAPRDSAQAQPADESPTALVATPEGTPDGTPTLETSATITDTAPITGTAETPPTPSGTPEPPFDGFDIFRYVPSGKTLAKRDRIQLDAPGENAGEDEVLLTITGPSETITDEIDSRIGVVSYITATRQWDLGWTSEVISGTAVPLLNIGQRDIGGYNGGDLLRTGDPILVLRTYLSDGRAQLHMWRWDRQSRKAAAVTKSDGAPEGSNTTFEGELDINVIDIDDDAIYEVVADNLLGVQIWKWDGGSYVLQEGQ